MYMCLFIRHTSYTGTCLFDIHNLPMHVVFISYTSSAYADLHLMLSSPRAADNI